MDFKAAIVRFEFRAADSLYFPPGKSGNIFRGALGETLRSVCCAPDCPGAITCLRKTECVYARLFEPVLEGGPSGLADPPRPFVLRPQFGDGRFPAGARLALDVHLFDLRMPFVPALSAAFSRLAEAGLGPGRGRAVLERLVEPAPAAVSLDGALEPVRRMVIRFHSPTELKAGGALVDRPEFAALAARVRDRIASLDRLYGEGRITFDWDVLGRAAAKIEMVRADLEWEGVERRSSRTGQRHPIGGFRGEVEYAGDLAPFLGILKAGELSGVGRQTVWGKGAYRILG